MKIAVYSARKYDRNSFDEQLTSRKWDHQLTFFDDAPLNARNVALLTAYENGKPFDAVCCFVNDLVDRATLERLKEKGIKLVLLRCAGFDNVDLKAAQELGITVCRVPEYSPPSVSEHALALILTLVRKTHKAYVRVREGDFSLDEQMVGFALAGKTAGVVGTGKIGANTARVLLAFGCTVIAHDVFEVDDLKKLGIRYVSKEELFQESDIISLHCPLLPETAHMINENAIKMMKDGVVIVNTSRGGVIDTAAVIAGLKSKKIGALGIDVYEREKEVFLQTENTGKALQDDVLMRLTTFPNVLITCHQAWFTKESLVAIAQTTLQNASCYLQGKVQNEVKAPK